MAKGTTAALERVRKLCFGFPATEEKLSYGTPAFHVRGKMFVYLGEDSYDGHVSALCKATLEEQRRLVESDPERYYVPKYFGAKGWVGVRLDHPRADWIELAILVENAWASVVPKGLASGPVRPPPKERLPRVTTNPKVARAALAKLQALCEELPGSTCERESRHATFRVKDRVYAYFLDNHHGDGHVAVCVKMPKPKHAALVKKDPKRFYLPAYVGAHGWVGVKLESPDVDWDDVAARVKASYDAVAPKRVSRRV